MSINRLTLNAWLVAALCCGSGHAQAPTALQALPAIRAAAEKSVWSVVDPATPGVQLQAATLDPRLRLQACSEKLDTFAPAIRAGQSRVTVRVSCTSPSW